MKPHAYPSGVRYVMVNGELVVDDGALTKRLAGRALRPRWTKTAASPDKED